MPDRDNEQYPGPEQIGHFFTGMILGLVMGFAVGGTLAMALFYGC